MSKKFKERMLPGDYIRKVKYTSLDDEAKELDQQTHGGFFTFVDELKGVQHPDRPFLVFYFDNEEDYQLVREYFELKNTGAKSHPDLDSVKLVNIVSNECTGKR